MVEAAAVVLMAAQQAGPVGQIQMLGRPALQVGRVMAAAVVVLVAQELPVK
jgi:hypothetical protein